MNASNARAKALARAWVVMNFNFNAIAVLRDRPCQYRQELRNLMLLSGLFAEKLSCCLILKLE